MVIPTRLWAIQTPVSQWAPKRYPASVRQVTTTPCSSTSMPRPPEKMPSEALRGFRDMMSGSAGSMPSARAGKQSVIRLIHSRWAGLRTVKPSMVAEKIASTSARLEESRNPMAFRMLS